MMGSANGKCELNELAFPASYFEDEVREGFYVSTMMKRYWAGQLKVLSEIDKVCRKHSIRWFAAYGTLIGAVRHGGYIPWDDDLDICMLRKDFDRFFEAAVTELPEKYSVFNIRLEPEYKNMIGRIVNNRNVIDYGEEHMRDFFGCPYTIGVDIFPMDDIYDDDEQEENRVRRLNDISDLVDIIDSGDINSDRSHRLIASIERDNQVVLNTYGDLRRELLLLSDRIYTECSSDDAEQVALMPIWAQYHGNRFPKNIFENTIMTSFENTELPVPGMYNEFLWLAYTDYMIINRSSGLHRYPVYEEQEQILKENIGRNPYRYTFSEEEFRRKTEARRGHKTTDALCIEMTDMLCSVAVHLMTSGMKSEPGENRQFLEGSQSVAISLGTMLEERVEGSAAAVRLLEEYCEALYECHEGIKDPGYEGLVELSSRIKKEIGRCLAVRRKRVIFLPCTAKWWYTMLPYYTRLKETGAYDILVLSLPYYEISADGNAGLIENFGVFSSDTVVRQVTEYDFEHGYADEIVIQIPYDGSNTSIRVPRFFYSDNLVNYTDKLTYLPYLAPECPKTKDVKILKSLNLFIEQPAVIYSDKIVLGSEGMKQIYVDRLSRLAGENTRKYWENKIEVSGVPRNLIDPVAYSKRRSKYRKLMPERIRNTAAGRRIIMYYVDVSYLLQYGEGAMDKMKRSISCFDDAKDKICCMFVREDRLDQINEDDENLNKLKQMYEEFAEAMSNRSDYVSVPYDEAERYIIDIAAYYGSAGELAHKCRLNGKPVMIMGEAGTEMIG